MRARAADHGSCGMGRAPTGHRDGERASWIAICIDAPGEARPRARGGRAMRVRSAQRLTQPRSSLGQLQALHPTPSGALAAANDERSASGGRVRRMHGRRDDPLAWRAPGPGGGLRVGWAWRWMRRGTWRATRDHLGPPLGRGAVDRGRPATRHGEARVGRARREAARERAAPTACLAVVDRVEVLEWRGGRAACTQGRV